MNEPPKNVLLQGWPVVADILPLAHLKGVLAVREDDRGKLVLVVEQMTAMDVRERYGLDLPCHPRLAVENEEENITLKSSHIYHYDSTSQKAYI